MTEGIAVHPDYALAFVLNELVTGFYPRLERADDILDKLEDGIILNPKPEQLFALADLRRELSSLHRRLVPLCDALKALITTTGGIGISKLGKEAAPWLHTYSERLIDLVERIDSYRQRTTEAMEGYGASLSNRQSEQINRLTVISWVFLPITFLTGFFGMNFNWAINGFLSTEDAFMLLGIGLPALSLVLTLLLFKSLGWVGAWRRKQQQSAAVGGLASGAAKTGGDSRRARAAEGGRA
jgi:magnesium transporter